MPVANNWDWNPELLRRWRKLHRATVYIDTLLLGYEERPAVIIRDGARALALVPHKAGHGTFMPGRDQSAKLYVLYWNNSAGWCARYVASLPQCMETDAEALKRTVFGDDTAKGGGHETQVLG